MKKYLLIGFLMMQVWVCQAQENATMPVSDTSQVRAGSDADEGPNWWFYGATGVAFMSIYYVLKKLVMDMPGDSGR